MICSYPPITSSDVAIQALMTTSPPESRVMDRRSLAEMDCDTGVMEYVAVDARERFEKGSSTLHSSTSAPREASNIGETGSDCNRSRNENSVASR